ncbi:transmembrane protein, putative [Bodo saltans]|uniref:Transmembrane protein, putative n=1 Tax=Bodo saltans TaxID=75058 RepID=A0A0S4IKS3_BODSA|nr:transmembrane protein, putative [Bodo saltans]|eukprot:CUE68680.1 transmembrane protein, putative [Bodo saltans]
MTSVRSESCVTSSKPLTADTTASRSLQVQMTDSFEWSRSLTISQSYLSARRSMTFGISHLSTSIAQSASLHTNSLIPSHTRLVTTSGTQTRTQSNSAVTMACSETNQTRSLSMSRFCSLTPFPGTSGVIVRVHQLKAAATLPTTDVVALGPAVPTSNGSSSSLVSSFTAPLSRQVLLRDPSPSFAFNISILLSDRMASGSMNSNESWSVVGVIRNVLSPPSTEGMFPLLLTSGDILVSTLSRVVVEQEQFLACVVSVPTSSRWLPTSLSTFTTVTMTLQVVLRCITDPAVTRNVEVVVPCPGQELILAAEVKAAASVAQYSTSLTGPAAGGAVGRLSAVRSLLTCDGSAVVAGMLPLPVTSCDKPHGSTSLVADARGFILGNFLLWASGLVLMGLAVGAYAWGTHSELRTATEALGVPSVLLPLVVVTVPSTASSTFVLLHSLRCTASDGVIAAVGGAMCVVPFVAISIVAYVAPRQLDLSASHNGSVATHSYRRTCLCVDVKLVNAIFRRRARWRSKDDQLEHRSTPTSRSHHSSSDQKKKKDTAITPWHRIGTVLLLDYAVVWYASVDIIVLTVAAVLGAVSTLQSSTTCRASAVTILVLYSGQLVLCATVRPFTTLFSFVFALLTLALAVLSVGSQVWYLLGSSADGVNLDALSRLVAAAAVCDMMVSGVSTLRMVIDGVDLLKACRRHVLAVMQHRRALTASRQPQAYVAESPPGYHPIGLELCLIDSPPLCGEHLLLQTDDVFWNIDGSAATLGGLGSVNGGGIATATQELRSTQQHVELMRFF